MVGAVISVWDRIKELRSDPTLGERGVKVLGSLSFKPIEDTLTGEEFAVTLATILAYMTVPAEQRSAVKVESLQTEGGKVYNAGISDGVSLADKLGG